MASTTIWKFLLDPQEEQILFVPKGARILSVKTQRGTPCLWAEVDPDAPKTSLVVRMAGTGHPLGDLESFRFVDTVFTHDDSLVWHFYVKEVDTPAEVGD